MKSFKSNFGNIVSPLFLNLLLPCLNISFLSPYYIPYITTCRCPPRKIPPTIQLANSLNSNLSNQTLLIKCPTYYDLWICELKLERLFWFPNFKAGHSNYVIEPMIIGKLFIWFVIYGKGLEGLQIWGKKERNLKEEGRWNS